MTNATTSPDNGLVKIGVFYDGGFFARVSNYYKFHDPRKSRISITGLHNFIREAMHEFEGIDKRYYQIIDAHYFRGRFSAYEASRRPNQLYNDRAFDDALMYANVVTHYLPLSQAREGRPIYSEKGIDVWFALECYELAVTKKYNVVVLITGDRDHLPLLRKLHALGIKVMLIYWEVEFPEGSEERPIRTSQALINEATYEINLGNEVLNRKSDPIVESIFLGTDNDDDDGSRYQQPQAAYQNVAESDSYYGVGEANFNAFPQRVTTTHQPAPGLDGVRMLGKIHHIDHANGHGYLHGINNVYDNLIFFRNARNTEAFNELQKYDLVEFEVAQNAKGDYATNVRFNGEAESTEENMS